MTHSRFVSVRTAMARDLGVLIDLEIKCQQYPRDIISIKPFVEDPKRVALIAKLGSRDIGYALCSKQEVPAGDHAFDAMCCSVGVHPNFRNLGVSKKLMSEVSKRALTQKCHSILMLVPSYQIDDPTDPDYIGWWFESMELKAARVLNEYYFHYGKLYDAYVFEAVV